MLLMVEEDLLILRRQKQTQRGWLTQAPTGNERKTEESLRGFVVIFVVFFSASAFLRTRHFWPCITQIFLSQQHLCHTLGGFLAFLLLS